MSSHWEWVETVTADHDRDKPFAPENGQALRFAIGDHVIFTNDYGVEFEMQITGFFDRPQAPSGLYSRGHRYLVDSSSPWFPVTEASLRLNTAKQSLR